MNSQSRFDDNKDKVEFPKVCTACAVSIVIGYLVGWYSNENVSAQFYCTIITIALFVTAGKLKAWHGNYIAAYSELVREHREQEYDLLERQEALERKKPKQQTYKFTSDDFTDDAINMLSKPLKLARKNGTKISGQGMIETILGTFK